MNKNSILFKLNLIFALTFIVSSLLFLFVFSTLKKQSDFEFIRKSLLILRTNNFKIFAKNENLDIITDSNKINNTLKNAKIVIQKDMPMGARQWALLKSGADTYLYVKQFGKTFLIKKPKSFGASDFILVLWIVFTLSILFLYLSITKSVYPLKILRKKIEQFKNGKLDIDFTINRKDEVGFLAREFCEAIDNLKKSSQARQWFLRNVAHELKTPIAKGMIASELLEDENRKKNFLRIFQRLDILINELLSVENIATKNLEEDLECCGLLEVIETAKKLLFLESYKVKLQMEKDYKIKVDKHLFSIAVKNLIDNGIKFSFDGTITIEAKDNKIYFVNMGVRPQMSESMMFEPFAKETSTKNKEGMGLGLYVTKYILDKHSVEIYYSYRDNSNIFTLDIGRILC